MPSQSPTISAAPAGSEGPQMEEPLSSLFQDEKCPTLSPRVETPKPTPAPNSPSDSDDSSISDDLDKVFLRVEDIDENSGIH